MAFENYEDNYRSEMEDDLDTSSAQNPSVPDQTAAAYKFEPELLQPTPRNYRIRFGTKIGRYIWMTLAIGIPVLLSQLGNSSQEKWEALKDHGRETEATLNSTRPRKTGKNGHSPRGTYLYLVNGHTHTINVDFSDEEYRILRVGSRRTVVYLPERPDVARMKDELAGGNYAGEAIGLWIAGGIGGLILISLWVWAERRRSRRTQLASEGIPVATSSFDMTKVSSKKNDNNWKVTYSYVFDGQSYDGSATFPLATIQKMLVGGTTTTVLVDPAQPKRHELYASVKDSIEIVAAPAGFGAV